MKLPSLALALAFAAIAAGESGATTFALDKIHPALGSFGPAPYFAVTLALCLVALRPMPRHTVHLFVGFGAVIAYLLFSSLWSDGLFYRDDKTFRLVAGPPIFLLAGYFIGRRDFRQLPIAAGMFAVFVLVAALVSGGGLTDALVGLLMKDESSTLHYQRFSIVCGLGAACLIPILNRRTLIWTAVAAVLAICALGSGGRTGALLVGVGIVARLALHVPPRILLPSASAVVVGGYFLLEPLLSYASATAARMNVPLTIQRALNASAVPPDTTRVWNRPEFFDAGIDAWLSSPIIGVGWGGYPAYAGLPDTTGFHPHNIGAELLAETGVVGFALFLIVMLWAVKRLLALPLSPHVATVWAALLCGVTVAMFVGDLPTQWLLFLAPAVGIGYADALQVVRRAQRKDASREGRPHFSPQ